MDGLVFIIYQLLLNEPHNLDFLYDKLYKQYAQCQILFQQFKYDIGHLNLQMENLL